jgi:hypothetical protein
MKPGLRIRNPGFAVKVERGGPGYWSLPVVSSVATGLR